MLICLKWLVMLWEIGISSLCLNVFFHRFAVMLLVFMKLWLECVCMLLDKRNGVSIFLFMSMLKNAICWKWWICLLQFRKPCPEIFLLVFCLFYVDATCVPLPCCCFEYAQKSMWVVLVMFGLGLLWTLHELCHCLVDCHCLSNFWLRMYIDDELVLITCCPAVVWFARFEC